MAVITPEKTSAASGLRPQRISAVCRTRRKRVRNITLLYLLIISLGIAAALGAFFYFQPAVLTHPDFDSSAVSGTPQVDERFGYSTLQITDGYAVSLCGMPANDGQTIELNLTNPADNTVWFRAEVLDAAGEVIGASGVLRQGTWLPSLTLKRPLEEPETQVTIHIVAYDPDTWQSRGNVNLNMTLYSGYS